MIWATPQAITEAAKDYFSEQTPIPRRYLGKLQLDYNLQRLSGDAFGGIAAAAAVLPSALAYGVMLGFGPASGLYGAIAVGFIAAMLGGTPARIAYPTAPMVVGMAAVLTRHANTPAEAFTIVMLAGLMHWFLER